MNGSKYLVTGLDCLNKLTHILSPLPSFFSTALLFLQKDVSQGVALTNSNRDIQGRVRFLVLSPCRQKTVSSFSLFCYGILSSHIILSYLLKHHLVTFCFVSFLFNHLDIWLIKGFFA